MKKEVFSERFGDKLGLWQKKYGKIYGYVSTDGKVAVLRAPDLKILEICTAVSGNSDVKFDSALLQNCWLDGDKEIQEESKYFLGIRDWLANIVEKVYGELGEL